MKASEIASRITGFSVPFFGVSWSPPVSEVALARQLMTYFEDRRVLYSDYELENPDHCAQSVIMIREFLTSTLSNLSSSDEFTGHVRAMRSVCRNFLDNVQDERRSRLVMDTSFRSGPESWSFFTALGKLRAELGMRIAAVAVMYGLEVEDDLARNFSS